MERWLKKREERIEEENFDPVKAERFQDGVLKSREKMQRELDEKAKEHQEVVEEVHAELEITAGHRIFSDQIVEITDQIPHATP